MDGGKNAFGGSLEEASDTPDAQTWRQEAKKAVRVRASNSTLIQGSAHDWHSRKINTAKITSDCRHTQRICPVPSTLFRNFYLRYTVVLHTLKSVFGLNLKLEV